MCDGLLVKVEKALYLWIEDIKRKRLSMDSNVLHQNEKSKTTTDHNVIQSS